MAIHFLDTIRDRIASSSGPFNVNVIIELLQQEGDSGDVGLLPLVIFKGLPMDEKVRLLARWVKNDQHRDALLRFWGIDIFGFFGLLGEMKVPMVRVLEEKHQLLLEATKLQSKEQVRGYDSKQCTAQSRLYELSGGCTRASLERDLLYLTRLIMSCTLLKYRVEIRIEELEGGR
ncbi:hypothetical protein M5X11_12280 [Paenibacillus alginolyticus]|uniref:hypothetical protein n=1 Tax=Paenibacillus alginolyticus TaxID=59839 RepID=UPI0003F8A824|nr:hypothetical protein [Paenibacillus alginolyticus]MCY9665732.1 hypothetical protein [Paenibacillus alginolyticus]